VLLGSRFRYFHTYDWKRKVTATQTLAHAAAKTQWTSLPQQVRDRCVALFLDTLAVCAAGLSHPSYSAFAESLASEPGCASVPGFKTGVPVNSAIQINGGATTVLQYQDGHRMARGHPVSHIAPTLLALAEETDAAADQIFAALVAGYEVGARIGLAMGGLNPALHDTGTWSCIGTAVSAAHLLSGGDERVIANAIESAAAIALMPYRDLPVEGATAHHLYIGLGATTGLLAARGSLAGLKPLAGTLERFFLPRAGEQFHSELLTQGIDEAGQWSDFESNAAYFKMHPTCAHLHGANDAILSLIKSEGIVVDDIDRIEIASYRSGLTFDNPKPENDLAARFSLAASTSIALCFGVLDETTLTDMNLQHPQVQALMKRIIVVHDPALDAGYPEGRPARITIYRKDGSRLSETVLHPLGDHTNPAPRELLKEKAERLLAKRFGRDQGERVVAAFEDYCVGHGIGKVSVALRSPAH
jgi:2-methylcitrate dehydratase PrpD